MEHTCKLCGGDITPRHIITDITYYHCLGCNLLQNFYWEDHGAISDELESTNKTARQERWPAGKKEHMYQKGWQLLELMYWPVAWWSRKIHHALKLLPGYTTLAHWYIKQRLAKVLDFGCGHGITVQELAAREKIDIVGLDPYAPTSNSQILATHLEDAHFPDNSYSGIFSVETFEHLPDFIATTKELYRILEPGGVLLVQTSRLEHPEYKAMGDKWFYLEEPRIHVQIFSERAMQKLATVAGFRSVTFRGAKFARFVK